MLQLLLMSALVAGAIGTLFMALAQRRRAAIEERLVTFTERPRTLEELELELPFAERVLKPFVRYMLTTLGTLLPNKSAGKVKRNIEMAGNPGGMTPTMFVGVRITLALLGLVVGVIIGTQMGGLTLARQGWHIAHYLVRRVAQVEPAGLADQDVSTAAVPAFYCEVMRGEQVEWSYWRPGNAEVDA